MEGGGRAGGEVTNVLTVAVLVSVLVFCEVVAPCYGLILEDNNVTLAIPDKVMTWDAAAQYCRDNGGHLATVTGHYVQSLLGTLMKVKAISFLWIGAREKESGWTWADDTGQGTSTFSAWAPGHPVNKDTEPTCAFLRGSQGYEWWDHPCAMQHAFICQMDISSPACTHPGAFLFSSPEGGSCLDLHQRSPCSWYEARARCRGRGGRLAVLTDRQVFDQLKAHLGQKLQVSGDYWIGLRDSELEWQQGGPVIQTWWEGGQPSRAGRCVQVEKFGEDVYLWANQDCDRQQAAVCQLHQTAPPVAAAPQIPAEVTKITTRWGCRNPDEGPLHLTMDKFVNSILFQAMAFLLGVILMLIPLIIVCVRKRRPERVSIKPRSPSMSTLDHHSTGTAGSTRAMVCTAPQQPPLDHSDLYSPTPPPPANTEPNIYSARPQCTSDPSQGQPMTSRQQQQSQGQPMTSRGQPLQSQGHHQQPPEVVAGAQPHGYVNGGFLSSPSHNQPAKAHAQALSAQMVPSKPRPAFGQAHGQPRLQRQAEFEMSPRQADEQLGPGELVVPPREEAVTSGVLYTV